jgi:hypothetical protein
VAGDRTADALVDAAGRAPPLVEEIARWLAG